MSSSAHIAEESYKAVLDEEVEVIATEKTESKAETSKPLKTEIKTGSINQTKKFSQPKREQSWSSLTGFTGTTSFRQITSEDTNYFRSKENLLKIVKLANLFLNEEEEKKFAIQLTEALIYIEQLNEVSTEGKQATFSVTRLYNVYRDDQTKPSLSQKEALQNAKNKENGYFKVKAIFNES